MLSPALDLLLVGGWSLIVFVPLLLTGRRDLLLIGAGAQAAIATVINMPHFMASYRIVYGSREMALRHKWASIYVPAILVLWVAAALWEAQYSNPPVLGLLLVTVSSAYLAWHYTGQVWGMMASFAYLEGQRFEPRERLLIRTGLRILAAWHISWFLYTQLRDPSTLRPAYLLLSGGTVVAFALGVAGLISMRRRIGKTPPMRSLVAWLAIFVWYAVMARDPRALFWIQIAHALQYLAFPIRLEINRTAASVARSGARILPHMVLYGATLLVVSIVLTQVVPAASLNAMGSIFGEAGSRTAPILVLMLINIHHYFTDGVIWHISNPDVRTALFAHVRRAEPSSVAGGTLPPAARRTGVRARR